MRTDATATDKARLRELTRREEAVPPKPRNMKSVDTACSEWLLKRGLYRKTNRK